MRYCYKLQAWIKDGVVARCGHLDKSAACHACYHRGAKHSPCDQCGSDDGFVLWTKETIAAYRQSRREDEAV